MARMRMVTRTVEVNTYSVMTCNTETAEVRTIDFKVGVIPQSIEPMRYLKKQYETETLKLCAITSHTVETILYGMPEDEFIKNASVLPPRTTAE
jgi:hypothetical protein|nr:MAG TPA: hypothetical protein [Caudoviricetes sp.]